MGKDYVMLAKEYDGSDPTGYWMSEKLDGVRATWNGREFRSRTDKLFYVPKELLTGMPTRPLDGEFWMGRNRFQETVSVVRKKYPTLEMWDGVFFKVFDLMYENMPVEPRYDVMESLNYPHWVSAVEHRCCGGREALKEYYENIILRDGEGVILVEPDSLYVKKRRKTVMKMKEVRDDEAVVVGYQPGTGKHTGRVGALLMEQDKGYKLPPITFKIGTGLSDAERENPPAIGATVTYSFNGLTNAGKPRHPAYQGVRDYD